MVVMPPAGFLLKGVSVAYGATPALNGVDLEIKAGEAVGLVGISGAGKTTLLRLLNGMVRPTEGCVEAGNRNLSHLTLEELRQVRSGIGFIHQDLSLIPNLRVLQNVLTGRLGRFSFLGSLRTLLIPRPSLVREVYDILVRVGIPEKMYARTDRLSGGQRQRVAIARALFQKPGALLADEPVSSVDPARARATVKLLTEISRERGLTLCISLHNIALAREFLPRLVGLREGRIVFDRHPDQLAETEFESLYAMEK